VPGSVHAMADHQTHDRLPDGRGDARDDGLADTDESDEDQHALARPAPTGVPGVDAVVEDLDRLDDRELADHPAVFERAHAELRRALDEPSGPA